jgi:hypothetical protein
MDCVAGLTGSFVVAGAQFAAHDNTFLINVLAIRISSPLVC